MARLCWPGRPSAWLIIIEEHRGRSNIRAGQRQESAPSVDFDSETSPAADWILGCPSSSQLRDDNYFYHDIVSLIIIAHIPYTTPVVSNKVP